MADALTQFLNSHDSYLEYTDDLQAMPEMAEQIRQEMSLQLQANTLASYVLPAAKLDAYIEPFSTHMIDREAFFLMKEWDALELGMTPEESMKFMAVQAMLQDLLGGYSAITHMIDNWRQTAAELREKMAGHDFVKWFLTKNGVHCPDQLAFTKTSSFLLMSEQTLGQLQDADTILKLRDQLTADLGGPLNACRQAWALECRAETTV